MGRLFLSVLLAPARVRCDVDRAEQTSRWWERFQPNRSVLVPPCGNATSAKGAIVLRLVAPHWAR